MIDTVSYSGVQLIQGCHCLHSHLPLPIFIKNTQNLISYATGFRI